MSPWNRIVILQDIVLAIVINTSAMLLTGAEITFPSWYPGTCSAFATNVLIQLIIPVPAIGRVLSKPLEGKAGRFIWSIFVENLIYVTCISFTMAVIQAGTRPVVDVWLQTYVYLVLIGYVTSLVLYGIVTAYERSRIARTGAEAEEA